MPHPRYRRPAAVPCPHDGQPQQDPWSHLLLKVLLALVDTGITREDAYAIVQENAMATWHEVQDCVSGPTFKERLEADPRCTVSQEKLDEIFDPWDFLTRIDTVFDRLEQLEF